MRHVIWDWNGTLVDDLPVVVAAVNVSLAAIGEPPIDADAYRDHYTRPVRRFYDRLLARPVTDEEWDRIDDTFHETYADTAHRAPLTDDAWQALDVVEDGGATQSILSMWWHHDLVPEVRRRGIADRMVRVDGNTTGAGDTKERLLEQHLERLGSNGRAVMVGDALDDAKAGMAVGIPVVLFDG
ncbi:MAG: HAD hydrolase-like protein, partial [Acidimicrobiia bacterium]|nr:HAD hydrolase-like protein [Acidimicrobiia bacterium]